MVNDHYCEGVRGSQTVAKANVTAKTIKANGTETCQAFSETITLSGSTTDEKDHFVVKEVESIAELVPSFKE